MNNIFIIFDYLRDWNLRRIISKNKKISNFKNYNKKSVSNILKYIFIGTCTYLKITKFYRYI